MNYSFKMLIALALGLISLSSCKKDPVVPEELQHQELNIDMNQYGDLAFLTFDNKGFEVIGPQELGNRGEAVRFALMRRSDATSHHWILVSPDDELLDSEAILFDWTTRAMMHLRELPASEYDAANPKSQADLDDLYANAKTYTPDGRRSGPLSPDTVILAKKDGDDTTYVIYIKICVEGDDWKVCIEASW
ncbi:MAG: hypothetical protein D6694_10350 [Gammaproteobacteria bacterium]|nr:MAG: hypothetical protein D6694_10350 [Gammaproteobacteria bacterium]